MNASTGTTPLSIALRPGVLRPDWSMIRLPGARRTLLRRLAAQPAGVAQWAGLDPEHDHVWQTILGLFRDQEGAPAVATVALAAGRSMEQTERALRVLQDRDLVVLDAAGVILAAYPFTRYWTGHRVMIGSHAANALCAIDALGVGALCGRDTIITSSCAWCHTPIRIETDGGGLALRSITPTHAVVWCTLVFNGRVAQSCCPSTVFFCGDAHLDRWANAGRSLGRGDHLAMAEAFEIGAALFAPLLRTTARLPGPSNSAQDSWARV